MLSWSVSVLAAFTNVYFPDTFHLAEVGLQILFYATPILYPPAMLQERGLGWLVNLNPPTSIIALLRVPILEGRYPLDATLLVATVTVSCLFAAASCALARLQSKLIFHL